MRKHKKNRGILKQPVASTIVKPEKRVVERKIVENPETGQFEVVHIETVTPAVIKQGKAYGPTMSFGQRNVVPAPGGKR
jgi:hypothetical protein